MFNRAGVRRRIAKNKAKRAVRHAKRMAKKT